VCRLISTAALLLLFVALSAFGAGPQLRVVVSGLDKPMEQNVRAFMSIAQEAGRAGLTGPRVRRLYRKSLEELRTALQPFGYYEPRVESSLEETESGWVAAYRVDPGRPVRVTKLEVVILGEGADDPALSGLVAKFPLQEGDVFVHARYEEGKRLLLRSALNNGYLNSSYAEHQARVYPGREAVEIRLVLASGLRFHFGKVTFSDAVIEPELVARFSNIKEGEPYSTEKLFELQNALFDSDYFSRVEVSPRPEQATGRNVPVFVDLAPSRRHRYSLGIGYGTDTKVRGSLGYNNRRINRRGHRFRSALRFSRLRESLTVGYIVPFRNPRSDFWEVMATMINDHPDDNRNEETYIIGVNRQVSPRRNWIETWYLDYRRDSFRLGDEFGDTKLLMPGLTIDRIVGKSRGNVQAGNRITLEFRGGHDNLLSDVSFFQPLLTFKLIQSLARKHRVLLRGEAAATVIDGFGDLPLSLRYYAGGDTSVRGYGYQRLGPKNSSGDAIGGKQKLVGSVEYDYLFREKWSVAAFVDTGNAFNQWNDFSLERGAGFGVRWYSPVGPLRVDLAWPVSVGDRDPRLHIIFGPEL